MDYTDDRTLKDKVFPELERELPRRRMAHVLAVTLMAGHLARRHGLDPVRARLAGALHDSARAWPDARLIRYVRSRRIPVPDFDFIRRNQPVLLHGPVSADVARKKFGVKDREVLSAIPKHSLGSVRMTRFEKLVYVADFLSHDRSFKDAPRLRRLAARDLDGAYRESVRQKLRFLVDRGVPIPPECVRVYNSLLPPG